MKSYTDISQSKKLAEFLPVESADMRYEYSLRERDDIQKPIIGFSISSMNYYKDNDLIKYLPCWSLAALFEFILPYIADNNGNNYKFYLSKDGLDRWIAYYKSEDVSIHICEESDNMINVIFEMVCWLKENNEL